jgi:hypothetical protein
VIAEEFNTRGLITRRGGHWNVDNVREMIQNPFYAGWVTERGLQTDKTASGTRKRVPRGERKLYKGLHESIISQELFDACMAVRTQRWNTTQGRRPKQPERYLLAGIATCSHCGRTMRAGARSDGSYPNYLCTSQRLNYPCNARRRYVPQHLLEPQADELIARLRIPEEYRDEAIRRLNGHEQRVDYSRRLKALRAEQARLNLMFQKSTIDEAYYDRETKRVKAEIAAMEKPVDVPAAVEQLARMTELWELADVTERATILRTLVRQALIDPDTQRVVDWVPREDFAPLFPKKKPA